jgi:hypothetical protein
MSKQAAFLFASVDLHLVLSVWLFLLFSLIGTCVGLYAAGVRVVRSHP